MNFPLFLSWFVVLHLGAVLGSMIPDDALQIKVKKTVKSDGSAIGNCLSSSHSTVMNVRLQELNTKSGTTFVRRVVSDEFAECFLDYAKELQASSISGCSEATEMAGLKMFTYKEGNWDCTGYSVVITEEQQGCTGSGTKVFYTTQGTNARAERDIETEPSPAIKRQAIGRVLVTMSTDKIIDDDGFKGIEGKGLSSSQTYKELDVINRCQCHYFCSSDEDCTAFSVRKLGQNRFLCSLANDNVYTNTPTSVAASYYAVRAGLVDDHAVDNLIYRLLDTAVDGYDAHKQACEAIPGFRLVAPRFSGQMPILLEICLERPPTSATEDCPDSGPHNWFYVDMRVGTTDTMIRDVLPLSETDLGPHMLLNEQPSATSTYIIYAHSNKLHDERSPGWNTKPVCQANVYGVNW